MDDIILVDTEDREIGRGEKMAVHRAGLLHRAFSVFLFRGDSVLLQKRAASKYHCGGLWTNTCCSHPRPGETVTDALKREIYEESGIHCEPERLTGIYQNLAVKDGYGPLEGMKIPPIINLAFICRYIDGEASVSEESEDVRWVTPEEATGMVTHPLYAKRLADMLKADGTVVFSSYEYDNRTTVFMTDENM